MSKLIFFEFQCKSCDHVFDELIRPEDNAPPCPSCSNPNTTKLISPVRFDLVGSIAAGTSSSDGMTTAIDRWDKMRRQKMKIEQKNMDNHGTYR